MPAPASPRLIGGEMHYWRVQPRHWRDCLAALKQLGVETLASYVPWVEHEPREGAYDFAILHEFLAAAEPFGFRLFMRPGPFYYSELRNLGVADHAVPFHKHHPEFRRKASRWIAAVMHELRPYLPRIVAVQADNEIDPMPHFYGEDQGFADWLTRRYGSVDALNGAWGSRYASLAEALPALAPLPPLVGSPRFRDSCRYRYDLATDYARWVIAEYRANGCTAPILLNNWPGVDAQHWHDLADLADLYGIDPYPPNECRGDEPTIRVDAYRYFRERLRLLRAVTPYPYIAEFGAGIWHGTFGRDFSPPHYRLTALSSLAAGVRGWNWYMLVNRDNWYGSPVNERGVIRPELGDVFTQNFADCKALHDAPPPATSFAVAWSWHYHQLAQLRRADIDDPLLGVLHEMGIEYDFVDVDREFPPPAVLFVCGEVEQPERLWQYVEGGGKLVLFQHLIRGCSPPDGTSHPGADQLESSLGFVTRGPVFNYRATPGEPVTARQLPWSVDEDTRQLMQLAVGRRYTTGYHESRGRGQLLVLGVPPSPAAIRAVHQFFDIVLPPHALTPGVHVSRRGDRLIVVNPGDAKSARIDDRGHMRYVDLPRCGGVIL
ncbi:MAG: beta-galactosidase [Phycisphaerae bacterium]